MASVWARALGWALQVPLVLEALSFLLGFFWGWKPNWLLRDPGGGEWCFSPPFPSLLSLNICVSAQTPVCLQPVLQGTSFLTFPPARFQVWGAEGAHLCVWVQDTASKREGFSSGTCDFTNSPLSLQTFFFKAPKQLGGWCPLVKLLILS